MPTSRFHGAFLVVIALTMIGLTACGGKQRIDAGPAMSSYPYDDGVTVYDSPAVQDTPAAVPVPEPQVTTTMLQGRSSGEVRPYTVMGQTYVPLLDAHGYSEEGIASWYGKDFHGKKTANGEIYDMHAMTAAHKLLPFGTQVRVTNLDNGRSISVRINDRGPFVANRIIDLSHTGAEALDMTRDGTARVRIESVGTIPGQRGNDLLGQFYVQIGSFTVRDNAHNLARKMQSMGRSSRVVYVPDISFHRVQVGPYGSLAGAESAAASMQGEYPNNFVIAQ